MASLPIEERANKLITNVADLDKNFDNLTLGSLNEKISEYTKEIKNNKKELTSLMERLTKMRTEIDASEITITNILSRIRNTGVVEEKKTLNWADESERDEAERAELNKTENVWVRRAAQLSASQLIYIDTPINNSIYTIGAVHIDNINVIQSTPKLHGIICYVPKYEIFAFYTQKIGLIYGNGLICNPPGNSEDSRLYTTMCLRGKTCKNIESCRFAHSPLDIDGPTNLRFISSPHYNSRHNNRFGGRNRNEVTNAIPFLDISELDAELINPRRDLLYRFGALLMNFILISSVIADRRGHLYM